VSGRLGEIALTQSEIERILAICGREALLVGGQALAFWALYYDVQPVGVLSSAVTTDVDFIGSKAVAQNLWESLGAPWELATATLDDFGPQTAKVYAAVPDEGVKQIDFLAAIVGIPTPDAVERAVEVELPEGATLRVLHPLDVLESRLRNLQTLNSKRNPIGVAQANLALQIARKFMEMLLAEGEKPRTVFSAVNRVTKLALDSGLAHVAFEFGLDVLSAIPLDRIHTPDFHKRQWPRVLARLAVKREKYAKRTARAHSHFRRAGAMRRLR
jgi:hypothetical protein